jgi:23S rRNA (cytidine1920-2'-O)/16S rRNA (cytidine1409-2'-O)-methyltransferase
MPSQRKERLDTLLVSRGLAPSREKARALILARSVRVNGVVADKAGRLFPSDADIRLVRPLSPYVSRGGLKLEAALDAFRVDVAGRVALDVGASTGGFTDCLLKRGARRVIAVDVGYGQLHPKLRADPRVVVMERCNARYLRKIDLEDPPDLATIDVSFISLRIILPAVVDLLLDPKEVISLVKPQFEVGRSQVGKGGVVRDRALHEKVLLEISALGRGLGLQVSSPFPSPVLGPKGNQEYFLRFLRMS